MAERVSNSALAGVSVQNRPAARTILVVEDDPAMQDVTTCLLRAAHYTVVAAANGKEAMRYLWEEAPPDLILLDLVMPGMNGWELIEALQTDPQWSQIPVVVLSGVADSAQAVTELRAAAVLTKPVRLSVLHETLARVLSRADPHP